MENTEQTNNRAQLVSKLDLDLMKLDKTGAAHDQIAIIGCYRLVFAVKQIVSVLEIGLPTMADLIKLQARLDEVKQIHKASDKSGEGKEFMRRIECGEVSLMELF